MGPIVEYTIAPPEPRYVYAAGNEQALVDVYPFASPREHVHLVIHNMELVEPNPDDSDQIRLCVRTPDIFELNDANGPLKHYPAQSRGRSVVVLETYRYDEATQQWDDPVALDQINADLTLQFHHYRDGMEPTDVRFPDGTMGEVYQMRLCRIDKVDGGNPPEPNFDIGISEYVQMLDFPVGGMIYDQNGSLIGYPGTISGPGLPGLTPSTGVAYWGVLCDPSAEP